MAEAIQELSKYQKDNNRSDNIDRKFDDLIVHLDSAEIRVNIILR